MPHDAPTEVHACLSGRKERSNRWKPAGKRVVSSHRPTGLEPIARPLLGMRIVRDGNVRTLTIRCPGLLKELIDNFGMSNAHPANVPLPARTALNRSGKPPMDTNGRYQELIGSLLYLATAVRPDIAFAANCLARFMTNPEKTHWRAAGGVIRNLTGTVELGLQYGRTGQLEGAVDAAF